eukprot:gene11641-11736_t
MKTSSFYSESTLGSTFEKFAMAVAVIAMIGVASANFLAKVAQAPSQQISTLTTPPNPPAENKLAGMGSLGNPSEKTIPVFNNVDVSAIASINAPGTQPIIFDPCTGKIKYLTNLSHEIIVVKGAIYAVCALKLLRALCLAVLFEWNDAENNLISTRFGTNQTMIFSELGLMAKASSTALTITQGLIPTRREAAEKRETLRRLLRSAVDLKNAIVFCNRKSEVAIVFKSLSKHGFAVMRKRRRKFAGHASAASPQKDAAHHVNGPSKIARSSPRLSRHSHHQMWSVRNGRLALRRCVNHSASSPQPDKQSLSVKMRKISGNLALSVGLIGKKMMARRLALPTISRHFCFVR